MRFSVIVLAIAIAIAIAIVIVAFARFIFRDIWLEKGN